MITVLIKQSGQWSPVIFKSLEDIPQELEYKPLDGNEHLTTTKEERKMTKEERMSARRAAYMSESDPIYLEIVYEAVANEQPADLKPWVEKIKEIKQRFPK